MEERDHDAEREPAGEKPSDADAEQQDPESSAAAPSPPGQEPGESKSHDL